MDTATKKILFFVPTLSVVGGIERWLQTILSNLKNEDIEVLYAYDSPREITLENYSNTPCSLHEVFTDNPFRKILKLVYRARSLHNYCKDKNVQTIIVSADGLIIATLLLKYFKRKELKVITVIHQEIKTLNLFSRLLLSWMLPKADKVVAVSQGIERELQQFIQQEKVILIYNAIDVAEIEKKVQSHIIPWSTQNKHLIAIGRIESLKRYNHVIEALSTVPNPNTTLHIIGSGSEFNALQSLVQIKNLTKQVIFEGVMINVFPAIAVSHALIVTSKFESFGVVIIEAMALGKPIIAYDCDFGPREILQSIIEPHLPYSVTSYGYLVRNGDIDALSQVLTRFINGEDTFDAEVIKKRAADFDITNIILQWEQLLI